MIRQQLKSFDVFNSAEYYESMVKTETRFACYSTRKVRDEHTTQEDAFLQFMKVFCKTLYVIVAKQNK